MRDYTHELAQEMYQERSLALVRARREAQELGVSVLSRMEEV